MSHTKTTRDPGKPLPFSPETPHPTTEQYEALPWTGITLILAVVGLLLFMAVPGVAPDLQQMLAQPRHATLQSAHQELSAAIEEYHQDHGAWPGVRPVQDGTDGEPVYELIWLVQQLEMSTDGRGSVVPRPLASHPCGPYLPGGIPFNPTTGSNAVRMVEEGESLESANDDLYGWIYDPRTGRVVPDLPAGPLASRDGSTWR